jgi:hypothetical protein
MSYAEEEGGSAYEISPPQSPNTPPEPVRQQYQRNQINEQRQARADQLVTSVTDGLKVASLMANPDSMPNTRALARDLAESRNPAEVLPYLRRYLDA